MHFQISCKILTMETKITLVYSTANYDCYQVSGSLVAWIAKGKGGTSVLFGYECEASDKGFEEAKITGLLLRTKDIEFLKILIESQTDGDIFGDSLRTNEKKVVQFPVSAGRPELTMTLSFHPMYGRRVVFKQELRFACMYYRRFREFVGLLGIKYIDSTTPALDADFDRQFFGV